LGGTGDLAQLDLSVVEPARRVCRLPTEVEPGVYCEKARHDAPLALDPANSHVNLTARITYVRTTGEMAIDGDVSHPDIVALNLNHKLLRENRKRVYASVKRDLPHAATLIQLGACLARWQVLDVEGNLPEYAGVAEYFLSRWIRHREGQP
jgi:hypothetical protein